MTHQIDRMALRQFFAGYAEQGHLCKEKVHVHCCIPREIGNQELEWYHHGAGYVLEVTDDAVAKINPSAGNNADWLPFNTINRITIHDLNGVQLREFHVTDGVPA